MLGSTYLNRANRADVESMLGFHLLMQLSSHRNLEEYSKKMTTRKDSCLRRTLSNLSVLNS